MALNFELTDIVTLRELVSVAEDNSYSVQYTPFGHGTYFIREAVPWKGVTGDDFWEMAKNYSGPNGTVASGLKKARDMSKGISGTGPKGGKTGVAVVQVSETGEYLIVPAHAAELMKQAGTGTIETGPKPRVTPAMKRKANA